MIRLSSADTPSSRLKNWNTNPMWPRRKRASQSSSLPSTRSPATSIVPSSTASRPAMTLSSVDLPQPEGPVTATNSPWRTSRSTPRSARTGARSAVNVRRAPRTRTAAGSVVTPSIAAAGWGADISVHL